MTTPIKISSTLPADRTDIPGYFDLPDTDPELDDAYSLYRAVSTLVTGNPDSHNYIRQTVIHFLMRVRSNPRDPLNEAISEHKRDHLGKTKKPLLATLDAPDLHPTKHVFWVIAFAVKISLSTYTSTGEGGDLEVVPGLVVGPPDAHLAEVLKKDRSGEIPFRFTPLLPDESGVRLIRFIHQLKAVIEDEGDLEPEKQTYKGLKIQEFIVAETGVFNDSPGIYNSTRPDADKSVLAGTDPMRQLHIHSIVVSDFRHPRAAQEIFLNVLARASSQDRKVCVGPNREPGRMRKTVAVDGEFVKYPRAKANGVEGGYLEHLVAKGEVEEFCSVLTLAVARHFFLSVNIVQLLENAGVDTVPILQKFFEDIVFNPQILKLWWNPQQDIMVLDNTISHMFQGTPHGPFRHTNWKGSRYQVIRNFRVENEHLNGERSATLYFTTDEHDCEIYKTW